MAQSVRAAIATSMLSALMLAPSADAATQLGQIDPGPSPSASCIGASLWVQTATGADPAYDVPAAGVVTAWSHRANAASGREVRLAIVRPGSGSYEIAGLSASETLVASSVNELSTRISVKAGDRLGLWVGNLNADPKKAGGASCVYYSGGDDVRYQTGISAPAQWATVTLPLSNGNSRVNVAAIVEPDADADGFGDETQDDCPSDATTQGACPPPPSPDPPTPPTEPDPVGDPLPVSVVDPPLVPVVAPLPPVSTAVVPKLSASGPARVSGDAKRITLRLRTNAPVVATVTGTIKIGRRGRPIEVGTRSVRLQPESPRTIQLSIPSDVRRKLLGALTRGRAVTATLRARPAGSAGDAGVTRRAMFADSDR